MRRLQFAVFDTGIGIPADKIGQLFQPFTQADGSAMRRYGGTGLGLAISQRLAKALGGNLEVDSQVGRGSTFTLTIDAGGRKGRARHKPVYPGVSNRRPAAKSCSCMVGCCWPRMPPISNNSCGCCCER